MIADLAAAYVHASGDSSDSGGIYILLLAGPAAGAAFFTYTYRRYRNADKTDQYERETAVQAQPVQTYDNKVDRVEGTKRTAIEGRNESDYRQRLPRMR